MAWAEKKVEVKFVKEKELSRPGTILQDDTPDKASKILEANVTIKSRLMLWVEENCKKTFLNFSPNPTDAKMNVETV